MSIFQKQVAPVYPAGLDSYPVMRTRSKVWRSSADSEAVEALMVEVEGAVEVPTPSLSFHQPPPPYRSRLPLYPGDQDIWMNTRL